MNGWIGTLEPVGLDAPGGVRRLRRQATACGWKIWWDHEFPCGYHLGLKRSGVRMSLTFAEDGSIEHCGCWNTKETGFARVNATIRTSTLREADIVRLLQPGAKIFPRFGK